MSPPDDAGSIQDRMRKRVRINAPHGNDRLREVLKRANASDELYALWTVSNVNAMERLGMTDHGPVHVKIVMNIAVKLLRMLVQSGIQPSIARHYGLANEDAEVVVALASLLHDVGMSIHRADHEGYSLFVAMPHIDALLRDTYDDATRTVVRSEILHAIIAHRSGGKPLTLEAGVVRIADALDMAEGRSRIPFQEGSVSIHSISAAAISDIDIGPGDEKAVRISIEMTNSAGVFQLDQLFRDKLSGSGLEPYIELEAHIEGEEKRLLSEFRI